MAKKSIEVRIAEQQAELARMLIQKDNAELFGTVKAIKTMLLNLAPAVKSDKIALPVLVENAETAIASAEIDGDIISVSSGQYARLQSIRPFLTDNVKAILDTIGENAE